MKEGVLMKEGKEKVRRLKEESEEKGRREEKGR